MILQQPPFGRRGVTLLEVLTAIFIMGVGLLAILTLFPLGALRMAEGVRNQRAADVGANADALVKALDLRNDPNVVLAFTAAPPADLNAPSAPVYVDPAFTVLAAGNLGQVPGVTPGVQRISPSFIANQGNSQRVIARWFNFQDEITFGTTGLPKSNTSGVSVDRPGTYSWACLVRRPRTSSAALIDMSIVVYASRPTDAPDGESPVYTGALLGSANSNLVTIGYAPNPAPGIRKGSWILDTTSATNTPSTVNAFFYQVAGVADDGTTMTLELETPLKADMSTFVVMDNVITVLDRGTSWRP